MAAGSWQGTMKSIAMTGIWPWHQLATDVIGGKSGAEALHTRIRPFCVGLICTQQMLQSAKQNCTVLGWRRVASKSHIA